MTGDSDSGSKLWGKRGTPAADRERELSSWLSGTKKDILGQHVLTEISEQKLTWNLLSIIFIPLVRYMIVLWVEQIKFWSLGILNNVQSVSFVSGRTSYLNNRLTIPEWVGSPHSGSHRVNERHLHQLDAAQNLWYGEALRRWVLGILPDFFEPVSNANWNIYHVRHAPEYCSLIGSGILLVYLSSPVSPRLTLFCT